MAVPGLRLDKGIIAFDFAPSIGILARDIDKMGVDIRSFREPLMRAIKEVMIPSIRKNFDVGGRPSWEPLSEVTIERGGDQLLVRSGKLRRVMGQINIWDVTAESATIKDLPDHVWYGKIHQGGYGTMQSKIRNEVRKAARGGKRINADEASRRALGSIDRQLRNAMSTGTKVRSAAAIPARPFAMIQPEDEDKIQEIFGNWIVERMRRAGFNG
jgi:phage gpG-like protein